MGIAAINLATASFAWRAGRRLNHSAASHEGRGALDDVNHVGIIGMNFDLAGLVATPSNDGVAVVGPAQQRRIALESFLDVGCGKVSNCDGTIRIRLLRRARDG